MNYLIKQAVVIPILFFVPVFVGGLLTENYSLIQQHASEITLTESYNAIVVINCGAILTGLSCIVLGLGIVLKFNKFLLTSILLSIFGVSMISNGIYPMGSILHGFYGIGLSYMILPFVACYELKNELMEKAFFRVSLFVGFFVFIYFWSMLVGLDPSNFKGLTQRIASVFIFGWIGYLAYVLKKTRVQIKVK